MGVLILLAIALLIPLTAVILDSQVGRAIANRLEGSRDPVGGTLAGRVSQLEGEIDRLSETLARLEEETVFLHRLLEERPAPEASLPPGERES